MNKHLTALAEFTTRLIEAGATGPGDSIPDTATQLYTIAQRMTQRNLRACNVGLTARQEAADGKDEATVRDLVNAIGLDPAIVKFNSDPRGYAVKFRLPNGRYNSWGGQSEGWGIPA